ncbi:hypothetical protein B5S28_g4891 [[Candida] boidinii]|nr:hypothetical protein B5S28_g4891 [[Candida] boidinii]OWB60555.1 hypothetical protein B5S29_g1431 [[Candida] boidinii]OWB71647.1 hypothetical protein B5S31_g1338 [[Candida] boidinii]OWB76885.1 hypothetical protein B5S32_g1042 [[Candida] boidinii]
MANFFEELWKSVFEPGTNPALIIATHTSFLLLVISLITLIYLSGSIHFINLLIISLLLWGSVTWFIFELEKQKGLLKTNEELAKGETDETKKDGKEEEEKEVVENKKDL